MVKYSLIFYFIFFYSFDSFPQTEVSITFEVFTKDLNADEAVYITGNDNLLGNWQPEVVSLDEIVKSKWVKNFSFPRGKKLEFKFTRGSWIKEALNDDGSIPSNYSFIVWSDTTISLKINLWADQVERKIEGQITGFVEYHRNFSGSGIKARDIVVWLPPEYSSESDRRYPVLYMHDGQNIVDPSTSSFQVDWQIDEAADSLIKQKLIEPLIIVGIYNTPQRNNEYSENDTGYAYMNFIVDSLKPFIDRNYRTKPDRQNTANGGGSLGGLISFILAWQYSEIFSKAFCFSPAFKIDRYNFVDNVLSYSGKKKEINLFICNGDDELDTRLQTGVDEMLNALTKNGYKERTDFYYVKAKSSQHGERDWSKNIPRALIYLFGTEKGKSLL
ncbi:MAG: histidine kinase [Chlorobiota bacterium]|nr:MAG: histidine kinase [Chlorobiota bacterium]